MIVGVDIGGSHITAGLIDLDTRSLIQSSLSRSSVNAHGSPEEIIGTWSQTILNSCGGLVHGVRIGMAVPGPFDYEHGISWIKSQGKYERLYGVNVKNLLAEALAIQGDAILMDNDAACFLRGEAFCGAARGAKKAAGFTLGTGLGSAWFRHGKSVDAQLWCRPFRDGIAEDYLSGRWFVYSYEQRSGERLKGVKELAERAEKDLLAKELFYLFGKQFAEFLIPLMEKDPQDVLVLGGNIMGAAHLFLPCIEEVLVERKLLISIKKSFLGEHAALIGAASHWGNPG